MYICSESDPHCHCMPDLTDISTTPLFTYYLSIDMVAIGVKKSGKPQLTRICCFGLLIWGQILSNHMHILIFIAYEYKTVKSNESTFSYMELQKILRSMKIFPRQSFI